MNNQLKNKLIKNDRDYVWHPFTQMKDYENQDHVLIEKAKGIYLYDADGNQYYDTVSSWWVNVHGHSHPRIRAAIDQQMSEMDHIMFSGFTHRPAVELSEKLVEITPDGLNKVFFSDNGSTAVEVALKMSFQYWLHLGKKSKNKFVYLDNSYHGDTIGAVSVGGVELFHSVFKPLLFQSYKVSSPNPYLWSKQHGLSEDEAVSQCLQEVRTLFEEKADEIAGFVIEPLVQAAGGMIVYPASYLIGLRQLCDEYDIHLIADEVAVGFGRTGRMFACNHADITPDLMCLSKGLTAGVMPLSVTLSTQKIYDAFYDEYETFKTFFHGHSFTGNPLACAVALENLRIFKDDKVIEKIQPITTYLQHRFREFEDLQHIGNIRGIGMIAAMDILEDKAKGISFASNKRTGYQVYLTGLKHGLIMRPLGDTIYVWLPLCATIQDIDHILKKAKDVLIELKLA
ncbi:adenosylmethionine--8-amino-7-oxononanoate transaminase [Chengkuizengella axinellae]|uniref:Adenosylmethionine-8-amino-7-oxononanoate aminotransferase n=1 Tax=Chengkuizengella axinellae TaxID=3064388 RepID=A0ABT9J1H6_9BACL|nr:adenosylmethionine--8-amino-7-oxononanoate transaminase [Chengkuizengella sp. 2205SS18-9]MDP5275471.1 adenosylmethionine--8-amino-7-oxononanoate transaminase [Chengkuizengella sp. 2205SS18-9]